MKEYSTAPVPDVTNGRTTALYGAGLAYALSKNFSLRGEFENYGSFGYSLGTNANSTGRLKFSCFVTEPPPAWRCRDLRPCGQRRARVRFEASTRRGDLMYVTEGENNVRAWTQRIAAP